MAQADSMSGKHRSDDKRRPIGMQQTADEVPFVNEQTSRVKPARSESNPSTFESGQAEGARSDLNSLRTIYLQIEYGDTPFATLGLNTDATEPELQSCYRALAMRVHPDKAPSTLRDLHTSLFQKVHAAYTEILRTQFNVDERDEGEKQFEQKALPETWPSLQARNRYFREDLRQEREKATRAKRSADQRAAAKKATQLAKLANLAEKREARETKKEASDAARAARHQQRVQERGQTKLVQGARQHWEKDMARLKKPQYAQATVEEEVGDQPVVPELDWEDEEDRLEAQEYQRARVADEKEASANIVEPSFAWEQDENRNEAQELQRARSEATENHFNRKTGRNFHLHEPCVSKEDVQERWDKRLRSGGRGGSVSLAEKQQREQKAAATMRKVQPELIKDMDQMEHSIDGITKGLRTSNMNRSKSASEYLNMVDSQAEMELKAFMKEEVRANERNNRLLNAMDSDVVQSHYLSKAAHNERPLYGLLEFAKTRP